MQVRLARADCGTGGRRNFLVLPAFDVVQHEYGSRTFRQAADRCVQVELKLYTERRYICGLRFSVGRNPEFAPARTALVIADDVDGQAVQPRRKLALAAEFGEALPRTHERFLREFFGGMRLGGQPQTKG